MSTSSAFRRALPLLTVTFVNRMASIALSLLPAILVAREVGPGAAAIAMGVTRSALIVGTLGGGLAADRYGLRSTLVGALLLTGVGVAAMIAHGPLWLLVAAACLAQVGTGAFPTLARLVLMGLIPVEEQREALAWQRATANLGLVVSFSLGAALGTWVGLLLALDAIASVTAGLLALRLPETERSSGRAVTGAGSSFRLFAWATAIQGCWALAYEAYMTSTAAQLRAALGPEGVSWYSAVMVVNVVGCAGLGVLFARWIDEPRWSVPLGATLLAVGAALGVAAPSSRPLVALGMAVATLGELLFTATSQYVWMSLVPRSTRHGTIFAVASTTVALLRAVGAALAFPVVVDAGAPALGMLVLTLPVATLGLSAQPVWREFHALTRG